MSKDHQPKMAMLAATLSSNTITTNTGVGAKQPTISVITVCFNSEATVGHTIASVNDQTYPNVEHVFVDGASTDQSLAVIKAESLRAKRLISEPDKGIYNALNALLSVCGQNLRRLLCWLYFAPKKVADSFLAAVIRLISVALSGLLFEYLPAFRV